MFDDLKYIKSSIQSVSTAAKDLNKYLTGELKPARVRHEHVNINTINGFLPSTINVIGGTSGTGKAQPLYSKIYTPKGVITMGEVKVGMEVCTPNGVANVLAIFPQGLKDCYRVHFTDNTSVDCCGDHLWEVTRYKARKESGKLFAPEVLTTKQLLADGVIASPRKYNFYIKTPLPLTFVNDEDLDDPYSLGYNIGINGSLGVIPKKYIYSSINNRLALVQGLMDVLGNVDIDNEIITFKTPFKGLMECFRELIFSLGGIATLEEHNPDITPYYKAIVNLPTHDLFRDKDLLEKSYDIPYTVPEKVICAIEYIGEVEQQCILINSEEHLYITDNCTITHNSFIMQEWEEDFLNPELNPDAPEHVLLRCNWEMTHRALLVRAIRKKVPELTLKEIYYGKKDAKIQNLIDEVVESEKSDRIFYLDKALDPDEFIEEIKRFLDHFRDKKNIWITIDHIGLIKGNKKFESINYLTELLNGVKKDPNYKNATFFIVMQLNREIEKRSDIRNLAPNRGDFYGSDSVFQIADTVIALHRPDRMGHEKYLQFSKDRYPHLEKYYAPVKGKRVEFRNFITKNVIFFHYLKIREEDPTMYDLHVQEMEGFEIEAMNDLGDVELLENQTITDRYTREEFYTDVDDEPLPF